MSETQREMTLDEWVGKLPSFHAAARELAALRAQLEDAESEMERLNNIAVERGDRLTKLGDQLKAAERLVGALAREPVHWLRQATKVCEALEALGGGNER